MKDLTVSKLFVTYRNSFDCGMKQSYLFYFLFNLKSVNFGHSLYHNGNNVVYADAGISVRDT